VLQENKNKIAFTIVNSPFWVLLSPTYGNNNSKYSFQIAISLQGNAF
jgi:hypothetical protein